MEKKLLLDGPYRDKDFFNFISTSAQPRHQWYYFKEGFSSSLIHEAAGSVRKKSKLKILDPFSGSGTTALTSSLLGHNAIGIEVNPFLHFTSQIKTRAWEFREKEEIKNLNSIIECSKGGNYSPLEGFSTFTKRDGLDKWLLNTSVIRRYQSALDNIDKFVSEDMQPLYKFAALNAVMLCSNVVKDGKSVRYKKGWQQKAFSGTDFEKQFETWLLRIFSDIKSNPIDKANEPLVYLSDSRTKLTDGTLTEEDFDLVITSPPYLNSFDYSDIYRPELFLGGFVKTNEELKSLRLKTLRSHVQVSWDSSTKYKSKYLRQFLEQIIENQNLLWNKKIPQMVEAYFDDMAIILENLRPRMAKGGQIWLVVSTSAYAGVHIPVDLILGEIGHELNFKLRGIHCLRYLRTSSQQYEKLQTNKAPLRESLIILEK